MPVVATKTQPSVLEPRGNRLVNNDVAEETKPLVKKKKAPKIPDSVVRGNVSLDSTSSSSDSSKTINNNNNAKKVDNAAKSVKRNGRSVVRVAPDIVGVDADADVDVASCFSPTHTASASGPPKRCDWITPNTEPLYTTFHDEEWGVPVLDDDKKLFELLVFSQALHLASNS